MRGAASVQTQRGAWINISSYFAAAPPTCVLVATLCCCPGGGTEWRALHSATTPRPLKASEVVIERGDIDRSIYFVAAGFLDAGITHIDGISISALAKLGAGTVIGEQSFFDGEP